MIKERSRTMSNKDIERLLKQEQIYKWEVAEKLGLHETTFCRWWRKELSQEQVQRVLSAVEEIKLDRLKE
jgi:transcriptional regulator with PAS, ATPase and Fis domain